MAAASAAVAVAARRLNVLRQAKVNQLDRVGVGAQHDVLRLDVAVREAEAVDSADGLKQLAEVVARLALRERAAAAGLADRLQQVQPLDQLPLRARGGRARAGGQLQRRAPKNGGRRGPTARRPAGGGLPVVRAPRTTW